jgi:hypothetical protein
VYNTDRDEQNYTFTLNLISPMPTSTVSKSMVMPAFNPLITPDLYQC